MSVGMVRKSICASLTPRACDRRPTAAPRASAVEGTPPESVQATPMRLMRLRDQLELTKEMTTGTVIYLSPHYRKLAASGGLDGLRNNMYNELSMQFGALGVKITSDPNATFLADQRSLMLLVLCPGFFGCSELVEETAHVLRNMQNPDAAQSAPTDAARRGSPPASSGPTHMATRKDKDLDLEAAGTASSSPKKPLGGRWGKLAAGVPVALELQRQGTLRRQGTLGAGLSELTRRFQRKPKALVPLASTAMAWEEYVRQCPADLKDLGFFEAQFEKCAPRRRNTRRRLSPPARRRPCVPSCPPAQVARVSRAAADRRQDGHLQAARPPPRHALWPRQ